MQRMWGIHPDSRARLDLLEQRGDTRRHVSERAGLLDAAVTAREHAGLRLQVLGAQLQPDGHALIRPAVYLSRLASTLEIYLQLGVTRPRHIIRA